MADHRTRIRSEGHVRSHAGGRRRGVCHCWTGAYIKNLAVAPEVRRRGLATALVTRALQEFAQRGASAVDLETEVDNEAAQALYTKLGFTAVHHDAT